MSRKNKKHIVLGVGAPCPKCQRKTETRKGTNHGKSFYFSQYDYCYPCRGVFYNEKYKILASGAQAQQKFNARIARKQKKVPVLTKTEQEIKDAKRAYGAWKSQLEAVMKTIK